MGRLPFDPGKMKSARSARTPEPPDRPLRVSELAVGIDAALKARYPGTIRVVGEVSGLRERTHLYFDLKDENAVLGCVMFASAARRSREPFDNGSKLIASGRLDFYAPSGRVSLIVDRVELAGLGELDRAFRKLCEELRERGWFDPARKRPLPAFPRRVAVVTSRSSAAWQDVLATAAQRCPMIDLLLADSRVQGEGSADEIARTIRELSANADTLGIDAILVTRGGGSMEDLWSFNEPAVARAILESSVPVVAAIGHESDTTIAELVADLRAATPTQAAVALFPDKAALQRQLTDRARHLAAATRRRLSEARHMLEGLRRHALLADPAGPVRFAADRLERATLRLQRATERTRQAHANRLAVAARRLDRHQPSIRHASLAARLAEADRTLARAAKSSLREHRLRLESAARELDAVGPGSVLARGYSITTLPDGTVVRTPADAPPEALIRTRLADGTLDSRVLGSAAADRVTPPQRRPRPSPRSARRRRPDDPDQLDLFGTPR